MGEALATTREQARARLPAALEVYSALRVPEGHALVDLSESRAAFSTRARIRMAIGEIWKVGQRVLRACHRERSADVTAICGIVATLKGVASSWIHDVSRPISLLCSIGRTKIVSSGLRPEVWVESVTRKVLPFIAAYHAGDENGNARLLATLKQKVS